MEKRAGKISGSLVALIAVLWLGMAAAALGQDQSREQERQRQDVIKVPTTLVTVPVMVTDRYGRFVTGLTRGNFIVREDGVQQDIADFSSTEAPFHVALLLDTSHSTQRKLPEIRKAAHNFIKQLQPNDQVLIVTFDDRVQLIGDFTSDHKQLERAVNAVKSGYATSLYDAIHRTVTEKLLPLQGRKAIVVLTDGVDTASKLATYESTLDLVSSAGIVSYAIQYETRNDGGPVMKPIFLPPHVPGNFLSPFAGGWQSQGQASGQAPNRGQDKPARDRYLIAADFLRALAWQSGARYLRAETIENTSYAFALIAEELRHQYTLSYYSSNEKRDGNFRAIEVSVGHNDLNVRARQGYRAPKGDLPEAESREPEKKTSGEAKP